MVALFSLIMLTAALLMFLLTVIGFAILATSFRSIHELCPVWLLAHTLLFRTSLVKPQSSCSTMTLHYLISIL
eukprot:SAG11_NODE_13_length_26388_cov_67.360341_32_plen_73_part_00